MPAVLGGRTAASGDGRPLSVVGSEVAAVLDGVGSDALAGAATFLGERPGRWFFTGQGRSGLVASMASMRFMHLGRPVHLVGEATAPALGADDHLVAVSASGRTPVTLHLAEVAAAQGADLLAVCASAASPLAAAADHALVLDVAGSAQFGGSLFEQSALLVLDALALGLSGGGPATYAAMHARHANLQ